MSPDQAEPEGDIVALPGPEGPVHRSTTDSRPESSDTGALTLTVRPAAPQAEAPSDGRPTVGAFSWVRRTVTGALPPFQVTVSDPVAAPSGSRERSAFTWTTSEPPGVSGPLAGETVIHDFDVDTWKFRVWSPVFVRRTGAVVPSVPRSMSWVETVIVPGSRPPSVGSV